jgi:hypothetical protein
MIGNSDENIACVDWYKAGPPTRVGLWAAYQFFFIEDHDHGRIIFESGGGIKVQIVI